MGRRHPLLLLALALPLTVSATHAPGYCELTAVATYTHHYDAPAPGHPFLAPSMDNCVGGDGHAERAAGGAWLLVRSGDAVTDGTLLCYDEPGHHPFFGPFAVTDAFQSGARTFVVAADVDPGCGDGLMDVSTVCAGSCIVTFPTGPDGAYHVFVEGATGHVVSP